MTTTSSGLDRQGGTEHDPWQSGSSELGDREPGHTLCEQAVSEEASGRELLVSEALLSWQARKGGRKKVSQGEWLAINQESPRQSCRQAEPEDAA